MPVKTGSSHGLAVLICTVLAAFLIEVLRPVVPRGINVFEIFSDRLLLIVELPLDAQQLAVTLFAATLAFVWGVVFRLRRRGR